MRKLDQTPRSPQRAAARGLVAAMAMTGVRNVTANVGLLERSPPEEIVHQHAPRSVQRLRPAYRTAITEVAHWTYGAAAAALFPLLPRKAREQPWIGPAYGLSIWLAFELGVAPVFGLRHVKHRHLRGRAVLALDHVLYGVVVAGRLAPESEATGSTRLAGAGTSGTARLPLGSPGMRSP